MAMHAAYLLSRVAVKASGKTPYEELHMARFRSPVLEFAEAVLAHRLEDVRDKFKDGPRDKHGQAYLKLLQEDAEGAASQAPTSVSSGNKRCWNRDPNRSR